MLLLLVNEGARSRSHCCSSQTRLCPCRYVCVYARELRLSQYSEVKTVTIALSSKNT